MNKTTQVIGQVLLFIVSTGLIFGALAGSGVALNFLIAYTMFLIAVLFLAIIVILGGLDVKKESPMPKWVVILQNVVLGISLIYLGHVIIGAVFLTLLTFAHAIRKGE